MEQNNFSIENRSFESGGNFQKPRHWVKAYESGSVIKQKKLSACLQRCKKG
jgi:hypothetical protein